MALLSITGEARVPKTAGNVKELESILAKKIDEVVNLTRENERLQKQLAKLRKEHENCLRRHGCGDKIG